MNVSTKIVINTETWLRDSHKLFDYECSSVSKHQHIVSKSCSILRLGNEVDFIESSQEICYQQSESMIIAKVHQFSNKFFVNSGTEDELWLVTKSKNAGHELKTGEIVKFGRVKLHVKRIKTPFSSPLVFESLLIDASGHCRICFSDENFAENPLISPCKCAGSMKVIHLNCLQTWINSKMTVHSIGESSSYSWKNMDCEICKNPYQLAINCIGPNAFLNKIEESNEPYIILETVERDKSNSRAVYLLQFKDGEVIKLGRGHESDIKIHDISVSRFHASIEYRNGKFLLKDNHSKFGTLVQIPNQFEIQENLVIQAGRTLLTMSVEKME